MATVTNPTLPVSQGGASAFIPLCVPEIRGNEWKYVKECLDTGWVSSVGSYVDRFERDFASGLGMPHAVATASGTTALHTSLLVAGIAPEDEVLVSTLTFIAPANAIRYAQAWPVFIDAEPEYLQIDVEKAREFLEGECEERGSALVNRSTGRRVRAIVPVHILGHPVDMDPILELARRYRLIVIEDATESLGASYKGAPAGTLGDIACFSFNGNKLLTTGGGGMIVTRRPDWAERAKHLTTQAKADPIEFVHSEIGYNYRLTNLQAAMGCAQFEQVAEYVVKKRAIATRYESELSAVPGIQIMREAPWAVSAFWMYTVLVDQQRYGMDSRALLQALGARGIQARPLWQPMHASPAHAGSKRPCPVADRITRDALSIPCSVGLTSADQAKVVESIRSLQS